MILRAIVLAVLLPAVPALAQVAAPKTDPPPKLTFAQMGLFIYPAKDQAADQQTVDQFKKAAGACLEPRGYSVR